MRNNNTLLFIVSYTFHMVVDLICSHTPIDIFVVTIAIATGQHVEKLTTIVGL